MIGLEKKIPDETERREHIFKNMLFGIAITELTGLVARRSLYYSKDAKNDYSIVQFKDSDGNIQFKRMEHDYVQGKCKVCGSPYENLERGEGMENYAYQFLHDSEVTKMKFDVIIGNPPYQLEDGGFGSSASPIYQLFVEQSFRLKPRYVSMIIPSRWFAGGKGLDDFRAKMLESKNFRTLVDFLDASEIFPGVTIKGGVCYFLWDKNYDGKCEVTTINNNNASPKVARYLGEEGDIFIRYNEALPILEKVRSSTKETMESMVSSRKPFGFATNFKEFEDEKFKDSISIYTNSGKKFIKKSQIIQKSEWIDKWKVLTPMASPGSGDYPNMILGPSFVAEPNSCCAETYLVAGIFETKLEAYNCAHYLSTKFARFMVALRKNTQHVISSRFRFVPALDFSKSWTDEELYRQFKITIKEQDFIDSIVREMNPPKKVD
jgi:site-specific DNA-methyltransferase (adenine-specific)